MSEALDLSLYARPSGDGTLGMDLAVDGISCGACIGRIESAVKRLPGVTEARLNFTNRRLHVDWTDGAIAPARSCKRWRMPAITAIRSLRCAPSRRRRPKRAASRAVWRSPASPP